MLSTRVRLRARHACWTTPGLRSERYSATLPSREAWRGVLRCVLPKQAVDYDILRVSMLAPPRRQAITGNELKFNGVGVSPIYAHRGQHTQRTTVYIFEPDYLLEFRLVLTPKARPEQDSLGKYVAMFTRRAAKGQQVSRPVLGTTECPARLDLITDDMLETLPPVVDWDEDLGLSYYAADWDAGLNYFAPLEIKRGTLVYPSWPEVKSMGIARPIGRV